MSNKVLQINRPSSKLLEFVRKLEEEKERNKLILLAQKDLYINN